MNTKKFLADLIWGRNHHSELLEEYRDEWVAIYKERIVTAGKDLAKVVEEAKNKTGKKQIPVYYVDSGSSIYES